MAVASVSADNTRVNDADGATSWANFNVGGPAPASEAQLKYQGVGAVNKKVTSTTSRTGVAYDPGSGGVDMTAAANRLFLFKGYVADFGDLNGTWGVEVAVGSGSGAYHSFNVAGSGANRGVFSTYPAAGGYLIVAIDPNVTAWREATTGTPDLTLVDFFGMAAQFVSGGAKSENMAMDAVDVGTGLTLVGGDGADPEGVFQDFVAADQGTVNNRWGYVSALAGAIIARGMLTIGSATATEFTDLLAVVVFPDGYHSAGTVGVTVDLQNAATAVSIGATLTGRGSATPEDTRPDFIVTGTSGSLSLSATLDTFRHITLTSACAVNGAVMNPELLTQGGAEIENATIVTNAPTSVACLQDPTFGDTTGLHDTDFEQGGAGHAIEIDAAGSYDFNGLTFSGYGADGQDDAALDVTAASGTVTINVIGGTAPTFKSAGATVDIVLNPVTLSITAKDISTGAAIQGARVLVTMADGANFPFQDPVTITRSGSTATVTHTGHGLETGNKILIAGANEVEYNGIHQITVTDPNTYTYTVSGTPATPATGTIVSTLVVVDGLTDVNGQISDTRSYGVDQPIEGRIRKGSASPFYQSAPIAGTIDSGGGLSLTIQMIRDE